MSEIHHEQLPNGLWLLAEPIAGAQSLSMTLLTPGGLAAEPSDQLGVATMLSEMIFRGAGGKSAREHSDALDLLGVHRSSSVESRHLGLSAVLLGQTAEQALPLLLDMIRRPALAADALEPSRLLALQSLDSLADEPQQRVMLALKRRHYPSPLNRSPLGERSHLEKLTLEQVRAYWQQTCVPQGAILGFAGKFDWQALRDQVATLLGDWQGGFTEPAPAGDATGGYEHEVAQTSQVHIALAYPSVPETDDASVLQRTAAAVLSGGMSGRLFTEVREKRGLCYAVHAGYSGHKDRGAVMGYAGTTTPRAQETLDVFVEELVKLSQGVREEEFQRAVVGMKSRLVMQGESSGARASAIAHDQYVFGRPRTLDELAAKVDAVTLADLNGFVRDHGPEGAGNMTLVTIGPEKLTVK